MHYRHLFTQGRAPLSIAMLASIAMVALDVLLINTAMPSLLKDLGGLKLYSWTLGAYSLGNFSTLPIFSVATSKWGGRISLSVASFLFALGAALGTQASSMEWVFLARLLMGFGGGGFLSIPFGLINRHFPHELKPLGISVLSSVWGIAALGGPALGGFILERLGWRWIFGLHLPLTLSLWLLSLMALSQEAPPAKPKSRINYLSPVLFAGLSACLLSFFESKDFNILNMLFFLIAGLVFYFWEKKHPNPILPLRSWGKKPVLKKAFFAMGLSALAFGGVEGFLPLSLQGIWSYSPLEAGLILTVGSLAWSVTALSLPKLFHSPQKQAVSGTLLLLSGVFLLILIHRWTVPGIWVYISFLLAGFGMGLIVPTYNTLALDKSAGASESTKGSMLLAMTWGFSLGPPLVGLAASLGFGQSFQAQNLKTSHLSWEALSALNQGLQFCLISALALLILALFFTWSLPKSR